MPAFLADRQASKGYEMRSNEFRQTKHWRSPARNTLIVRAGRAILNSICEHR